MALHRTSRLKIYGDAAEVEKLINNRWRITVRCLPSNKMEDWFYENKGQTFSEFNSTMDDEIPVDGILRGWSAREGESWKDARLIHQSMGYTPTSAYIVTLVYETLTSTWTGVEADTIQGDINGLRTLQRTLVAEAGTAAPYNEDDIGVSTITNGGKTLYLSSFTDQSDERMGRFTEKWAEAGVLSVFIDEDSVSDAVKVTTLGLSETEARAAVAEVTANHSAKSFSIGDYEGYRSNTYDFEIRATDILTELGDQQIGVDIDTGIQTDGTTDFIITRDYSISSANAAASIVKLIPPAITDPIFADAYIVDQDIRPNGGDGQGAVLRRVFAMIPTPLTEWDELVVQFPGVEKGPFQLAEDFPFRTQPYSAAVPVKICRTWYKSNPQRITRPCVFRPVDKNGNQTSVLTDDTVPTADEYLGFVASGKYLVDRVEISRWQGDIWERRVILYRAE